MGGRNLEIIGKSKYGREFFPGMTSRISGIGLEGLEKEQEDNMTKLYQKTQF